MNVTLRQLQAFVYVARLRSFTRAAQCMHVTQSALSLLVRDLESALATRLIDRTTRNVSLTVTGADFYPSAERLLADLSQALSNVHELQAKRRGRVVIAAPIVLSSTFLPSLIAAFGRRYPGIEVVLHDLLPKEVMAQVRSGVADIAVGTFPEMESDIAASVLFGEPLVAVFPSGHALSGQTRLTWRQLAKLPLLVLRRGSPSRDLAEAAMASVRLRLEAHFEANYAGSLIGLVEAGLGVAIVFAHSIELARNAGIAWKRIDGPVVQREVQLIHRTNVSLSPAAESFAQFLVGHFSSHRRRPRGDA